MQPPLNPLVFPDINPVALQLGSFAIRWYALAYIMGVLLGWAYALHLARKEPERIAPVHYDNVVSWIILGILLGGRLGYVLFYNLPQYLAHPLEILMVWHGGMAFHGGLSGVILATWLYCRRHRLRYLAFMDIIACVTPIGLFFGRIANFINGELVGRVTDSPLGMIFPHGGPLPRHPSQLYQAGLEGVVLFGILNLCVRIPRLRQREGFLCGVFLFGYGVLRSIGELFREPDQQLGFLAGGLSMGQWLCVPMLLAGLFLMCRKHAATA